LNSAIEQQAAQGVEFFARAPECLVEMRAEGFRWVPHEGEDGALKNALPARPQGAQRIGAQLPRPPSGRLQVEERGFGGRGFQRAHSWEKARVSPPDLTASFPCKIPPTFCAHI